VDELSFRCGQMSVRREAGNVLPVIVGIRDSAVYLVSQVGVATADVVAGTVPPTAAALRPLLYGSGAYLVPVHTCLPLVRLLPLARRSSGRCAASLCCVAWSSPRAP
jgi:hypothetical protein